MNSDFGSFRLRPSLSMALVLALLLLSMVWIMRMELPLRHFLSPSVTYASGWAQLSANFAIAAVGVRTPQRNTWLVYLGVSVLSLVAFGSTPFVALWFVTGMLKSFLG